MPLMRPAPLDSSTPLSQGAFEGRPPQVSERKPPQVVTKAPSPGTGGSRIRERPYAVVPKDANEIAFPRHDAARRSPVEISFAGAGMEILDSIELALRLKVKESWVVEQSKRSRTSDPIPVFRLGKHRRYRWGSPEMNDWLARRAGCITTERKAWS